VLWDSRLYLGKFCLSWLFLTVQGKESHHFIAQVQWVLRSASLDFKGRITPTSCWVELSVSTLLPLVSTDSLVLVFSLFLDHGESSNSLLGSLWHHPVKERESQINLARWEWSSRIPLDPTDVSLHPLLMWVKFGPQYFHRYPAGVVQWLSERVYLASLPLFWSFS
jgi:hypothetical protein